MPKLPRTIQVTVGCGTSRTIEAYDANGDKLQYQVIAQPGSGGPPADPPGGSTGASSGGTPPLQPTAPAAGGLYRTKPGSGTTASIMVMSDDLMSGPWDERALPDVDILCQPGVLPDLAQGFRTRARLFDASSIRIGEGGTVTLDLPTEIDTTSGADLTFLVIDKG